MSAPRILEARPGDRPLPLAGRESAVVVLSGTVSLGGLALGPGDAAVGPSSVFASGTADVPARLLLDERDEPGHSAAVRIGRDDLVGTGLAGVTGVRFLHRSAGGIVLRLGPPPGVRWLITGLRAVAVFTGRLLLFTAGEVRTLSPGDFALPDDPRRTLPLQAGNDSAVALALAAPDVRIAIG